MLVALRAYPAYSDRQHVIFFTGLMYHRIFKTVIVPLSCAFLLSACSPVAAFLTNNSFLGGANSNDSSEQVDAPYDGPFTGDVRDTTERIERVERAVIDLREKMEAITPAVSKLSTLEMKLQKISGQLDMMQLTPASTQAAKAPSYSYTPQNTPPTAAPVSLIPDKAYMAPSPSAQEIAGAVKVKKLRLGDHKDKTRIVLDVSGPATYHYDLDNNERLLVIELPNTGWAAQREWSSKKGPLIGSYSVHPLGTSGGSRVVIQLKKNTSVIYETTIPANGSNDYRIVLDLARS